MFLLSLLSSNSSSWEEEFKSIEKIWYSISKRSSMFLKYICLKTKMPNCGLVCEMVVIFSNRTGNKDVNPAAQHWNIKYKSSSSSGPFME